MNGGKLKTTVKKKIPQVNIGTRFDNHMTPKTVRTKVRKEENVAVLVRNVENDIDQVTKKIVKMFEKKKKCDAVVDADSITRIKSKRKEVEMTESEKESKKGRSQSEKGRKKSLEPSPIDTNYQEDRKHLDVKILKTPITFKGSPLRKLSKTSTLGISPKNKSKLQIFAHIVL